MMLSNGCETAAPQTSRHFRQTTDKQGYVSDPVADAALTGAAFVRHLGDARFATLRALRQLLGALDAERVAVGQLSSDGRHLHEDMVWSSGFGRCGDSELRVSCEAMSTDVEAWLRTSVPSLCIGLDVSIDAWQEVSCDQLLLVRGAPIKGGFPVFAAQLRGGNPLSADAAYAISLLLNEYVKRTAIF